MLAVMDKVGKFLAGKRTKQDAIIGQLTPIGGSTSPEMIIADLVHRHNISSFKAGVDYYHNMNDINYKQQYYWKDGVQVYDVTKTNNKISHNWHKLLVDQKRDYLVGKPMSFESEDLELTTKINEILGDNWNDIANELVKNASNKGVEYLQPYIDAEGNFDYMVIPAEEIIPIYDNARQKVLIAAIRCYKVIVEGVELIRAEYWDDQTVTYYIQAGHESKNFMIDTVYTDAVPYTFAGNWAGLSEVVPVSPHFTYNGQGYGWGRVPIIEFRNNQEKISDLVNYKSLIDDYDLVVSNSSNTLADIQDLVLVLKNFGGTNLKEFLDDLRFNKVIKVNDDGGVENLQNEMPIAARDSHLDRLEENIFVFGQGINTKNDSFGNAASGEAMKFLYQSLDSKCNSLELKFQRGLRDFLYFCTFYVNMKNNMSYDYRTVKATFNKSILANEKERIDNLVSSVSAGIMSIETALLNHPLIDDAIAELEKIDEQSQGINALNEPLDDVDFATTPTTDIETSNETSEPGSGA